MGFFSNFTYWLESGYFDANPKDKWLLHTWSLSVEWQFYIVYPLVLIALKRFLSINTLKKILVLGTLLGFIFSAIATTKWPDSAYYLLTTRAWQLMFGGIAFLYPISFKPQKKKLIESTGFALIITSYIFVTYETPWPGYAAILPVLGSYLIILANRQTSVLTNNVVFQALGKWSYSIYLWHWPLVVLLYLFDANHNIILQISMTLFSVILGYLSYTLIERNFNLKFVLILLLMTLPITVYIKNYNPKPLMYNYIEDAVNSMERKKYECFNKPYLHSSEAVFCELSEGKGSILALGDSHMNSLLPVFEKLAKQNNFKLHYAGYGGCPPIMDTFPIRTDQDIKNCALLNAKAMQFAIDSKVDVVFLAARWTYYTKGDYSGTGIQYLSPLSSTAPKDKEKSIATLKKGLRRTLLQYKKQGIKVILLLQVPMQKRDPDKIYFDAVSIRGLDKNILYNQSVNRKEHDSFQKDTNAIIREISREFNNVSLIDPTATYCDLQRCIIGDPSKSFYFDDDHLSIDGSYKIRNSIQRVLIN